MDSIVIIGLLLVAIIALTGAARHTLQRLTAYRRPGTGKRRRMVQV